jgi:uncharacterized protein (TIGR02996 family)
MSDEAAFLAALRANPADDTTRLVYADWLDEHGELAKAEYLRLVAALAQHESCLPNSSEAIQLLRGAEDLPAEWREQAGSRFALLLESWTDKILAIKWLRQVTGDGLADAKNASESLPHVILDPAPFEVVAKAYNSGAAIRGLGLRIAPGPLNLPPDALCDLVIQPRVFGWPGSADAAHAVLVKVFVTALDISVEEADALADVSQDIVVATGLTRQKARQLREKLRQLIPKFESGQGYWLHNLSCRRAKNPNNP